MVLGIVVIAAVLIYAASVFIPGFGLSGLIVAENAGNSETVVSTTSEPSEPVDELSEFEKIAQSKDIRKHISEQYYPHREDYGLSESVVKGVFGKLPPIPEDFGIMKYLIMQNKWFDLDFFGPEYYEQPEFVFPNFAEGAVGRYLSPAIGEYTPIGWGAFVSQMTADTFPGAEFYVTFFMFTAAGVQSYQGAQLIYFYPTSAKNAAGEVVVTQDPAVVSRYFDVTLPDEKVFLLPPTFPSFERGWSRKIRFNLKVHEDTPEGNYVLAIDLGNPPEEKAKEWLEKYDVQYTNIGASFFQINPPHFQLLINVAK